MNQKLLNKEVQEFIRNNEQTDPAGLVLRGSPFEGVSGSELAAQVQSRAKCKDKLPSWFKVPGIYYPPKLHIEQSSSEVTAAYKAELVDGDDLIDLTGGFGADSYYFAKRLEQVIHCEIDKELSSIVAHNFNVLDIDNIECLHGDGMAHLKSNARRFSWIYADPSRRDKARAKVFLLKDCEPDLSLHLDLLFSRSDRILVKMSPMLDIRAAIEQLAHVREIHVIAIRNDVKELLFLLHRNYRDKIRLFTVNIRKDLRETFDAPYPPSAVSTYSMPLQYLYEPNAAILKAGLFHELSEGFQVHKLHPNSHLFTSEDLKEFPGRRFLILSHKRYHPKKFRKEFPLDKANISVRNFRHSVAEIRKVTRINEGGDDYLFFTTDLENTPLVIHCRKVRQSQEDGLR